MAALNLNLSDELLQFVNGQVENGQFEGPASYIEALLERARDGKEKLESLLIEGLDSGDPIPLDESEWGRIRSEVEQRILDGK